MHLFIKEEINYAKEKAKQDINVKIEEIRANAIAKTHFVVEIHRLKKDEMARYLANPSEFYKSPNNFPFIQLEMKLSGCSVEQSVETINSAIQASEAEYLNI